MFIFMQESKSYKELRQYVTYGSNEFIADVGGYMVKLIRSIKNTRVKYLL